MKTSGMRILAVAAMALLLKPSTASSSDEPRFPVSRAEPEFRELLPFVLGWAQQNSGDVELFKRWVLPFAPLHLEVGKANHREASDLRNFYLGIVGAAFKVDTVAMANDFHCGPGCTQYRRSDLQSKLSKIEPLVARFRGIPGVHLLANWGTDDDFRVNELFRINGQENVTRPSAVMGFLPSGAWEKVAGADKYIASFGAKPGTVHEVLNMMRELSLAALVADPGGTIRVIRVGIGDNEAGLLFTKGPNSPCNKGDKLKDGREIVLIERVKVNVYFYETS